MNKRERLENWINMLENSQKNRILLEMIDYAIDSEYVCFYDDDEAPVFDSTGERLDEL